MSLRYLRIAEHLRRPPLGALCDQACPDDRCKLTASGRAAGIPLVKPAHWLTGLVQASAPGLGENPQELLQVGAQLSRAPKGRQRWEEEAESAFVTLLLRVQKPDP